MSKYQRKKRNARKKVARPLLKKKREAEGSQREVAEKFGITEIHMRHLENGYADPSPILMFHMGDHFEESVYDLFPDLADPNNWESVI